MRKLLADKGRVYHLGGHAIVENEDGSYEYISWDDKSGKVSWIRGQASVLDDILCLRNITSEGEEETIETRLELKQELQQLPKWDKTKYYCVIVGGQFASLVKYCETGAPLQDQREDYQAVREMLTKYGVTFGSSEVTAI